MKKEKNIPKGVNGYSFMHGWFNYLRDNFGKVNTYHSALYMYIVHRANTLGWVKEIGLPTDFTFQRAGFVNANAPEKLVDSHMNQKSICKLKRLRKLSRAGLRATIASNRCLADW